VWRALSAVIASEAKQSIEQQAGKNGLLRFARNDDNTQLRISRREAPEVCVNVSP
jgi:hypothetical protein